MGVREGWFWKAQLLSVTASTPGSGTGPPVLNRSPCGQEAEDDQEREISLGPSVEVVELF